MTPRSGQRARKIVFFLHLWIGLIAGGWFVLMGLSGSILAWKEEGIVWELKRRAGTADTGEPIPLTRAVEAMKAAYPKSTPLDLAAVVPPNHSFPTFVFIQQDMENVLNTKIVLVDPYTAKVTPAFRIRDTVIGFFEYLHSSLLLGAKGTLANGFFAAFAAALLLSGMWLWWPSSLRQWRSRISLKGGASYKRIIHDLHNIQGIYTFPLLLLLTLTAIVMAVEGSFNQPLEKLGNRLTGTPPEPPPPTVKPNGKPLSNDRLFKLAQAAVPNSSWIYLMMPMKADAPFQGYFTEKTGKGLLPGGEIFLDPYSGKVIRLERDAAGPLPHQAIHLNESLHYGVWGGVFSKLLYTLAGLIPLGLFVTGVLNWVEKRKGKARIRSRRRGEGIGESLQPLPSFEKEEAEAALHS
jgi:uncharacterized iron-regulated membrane protein